MPRREQHVFLICPHCFRSTTALAADVERELDRLIHSLWPVPQPADLAARVAAHAPQEKTPIRRKTTEPTSHGLTNSRRGSRTH